MANAPVFLNELEIALQLIDRRQNPDATHRGVQSLRDMLSQIHGIGDMHFTLRITSPTNSDNQRIDQGSWSYIGARFRIPLDKFKVVIRCLCDWLDLVSLRVLIAIKIPLARMINSFSSQTTAEYPPVPIAIEVETESAKDLTRVLTFVEALLPPQETYQRKAEAYIKSLGELTPAAKANLDILRRSLDMSEKEVEELDASAEGLFKTLTEKYEHFRNELKVIKQESDLTEDFWKVMRDKADTMKLPSADVAFLKLECQQTFSDKAEHERQKIIEDIEAEKQKLQKEKERGNDYQKAFEEIVACSPASFSSSHDNDLFSQNIMNGILGLDFNRGRLDQARKFYEIDQDQASGIEIGFLHELCLLVNQVYSLSTSIVLRG